MDGTTNDEKLNTCQHCGGEVHWGRTEQGFAGFVHNAHGYAACVAPETKGWYDK